MGTLGQGATGVGGRLGQRARHGGWDVEPRDMGRDCHMELRVEGLGLG